MNRLTVPVVLGCLVALAAMPSPAHHSSAMFDKDTVIEVTATVREFQWTNPHIWIQILIENEAGEPEEWSIEGGGTNTLFRRGWRPDSFSAGDEITIRFNPMKDGSPAGGFIAAKLADGSILGNW
jgi:hypothetical protein